VNYPLDLDTYYKFWILKKPINFDQLIHHKERVGNFTNKVPTLSGLGRVKNTPQKYPTGPN
jgi:hypothetical protein